ncbi:MULTISPECIES: hypothetical protein [Arthrobacter]|uniref:Uncharacterized protein n=1 Tax=Arthrobacter caoxuetaonis TaxID=2886935 RepID=A0A9X1MDJ1_9MICC|nr:MULTISPECIES: hypothetical protein [Arthrobacter]MCC3282909.1 hypothetical protein [Arthrobacter caoxuetaonis]MCC3298043.1 hypothetical protein [Arthrobacter caoxuetaonis]MCC9192162.1 hypothetical protein [Arthrobacter sp. zg-Y916]USQ57056.1 hypothetical protein NF551_15185 [Arthrobacter caoxuetaonis]
MARLLHDLRRLRKSAGGRLRTPPPTRGNHEEIHARLSAAMSSAQATGRMLDEQERVATEAAAHFASVAEAYRLRHEAVETVMSGTSEPSTSVLTLAGTARRMHSLAHDRQELAASHLDDVRSRRERVQELISDLVKAQAQLRLAVTVEQSKARLDGLGGPPAALPGPSSSFDEELREATRLAREAEALAELKGGWA